MSESDTYPNEALPQLLALVMEANPKAVIDEDDHYLYLTDSSNKWRRGAVLMTLLEFKKLRDDNENADTYPYELDVEDFVYFRRWGKVLVNVNRHTSHELFLANWVAILNHVADGKPWPKGCDDLWDARDKYDAVDFLTHGHGIYLSRAWGCSTIHASAEHPLNFQEKKVFGDRIRYHEKD